uniref:AB hydrolase-1 domain-containing protein n=1 Tax=Brassica oleracea var. oleracea TaxID=109376 RepID=A0A0D3B2B3_BRAOL
MMLLIIVSILVCLVCYIYRTLRPPPSRICGTPRGPPVTARRVKLSDGRHLAYRESGVDRDNAKYKIIVVHGFGSSKHMDFPISKDLVEEQGLYFVFFDRAGYGQSDPHPSRTIKSEAYDIQELADKLNLGPKFYVIGVSLGAYSVYSCLKYIPHRLAGAVLVVPFVPYSGEDESGVLKRVKGSFSDQENTVVCVLDNFDGNSMKVAELLILLIVMRVYFFKVCGLTDFTSFSTCSVLLQVRMCTYLLLVYGPVRSHLGFPAWRLRYTEIVVISGSKALRSNKDLVIIKKKQENPNPLMRKARQQGDHECLHRDMIAGFTTWEFDPTELENPFEEGVGSVHMWQGMEDRMIPREINQYISKRLPWIKYHEVPGYGHLLNAEEEKCEDIIKALLV